MQHLNCIINPVINHNAQKRQKSPNQSQAVALNHNCFTHSLKAVWLYAQLKAVSISSFKKDTDDALEHT